MRSLMISVTIILFVFSINALNTLNAEYYAEKGRPLFGFNISTDYNYNSAQFDKIQRSNWNTTATDGLSVRENPSTGIIDTLWNLGTAIIQGIGFMKTVLWDSTINFSNFIQNPVGTIRLLPASIAQIMGMFVILNHGIALYQLIGNRAFKAGYA